MPIKLPKGFPRRKSSGNALDDVQTTEPSFKVYSRPQSAGNGLDMNIPRKKPQSTRKTSFEQDEEDLFTVLRPDASNRGGTQNSLSTAHYDSGASSTRLSTSSTNPSSVDTRSEKEKAFHQANQRPITDVPVPPQHGQRAGNFLRNAGRTFSFGVKSQKDVPIVDTTPVPPVPPLHNHSFSSNTRDRSMTTSSVSTAIPPRILDSDLVLDPSEDDSFGNMFDGIGKRASREPSPARQQQFQHLPPSGGNQLHPETARPIRVGPPRPININRTAEIESSPYSWTSETSRDGLMRSPSPSKTVTQNSPLMRSPMGLVTSPGIDSAQEDESLLEDNLFANPTTRPIGQSRSNRQAGPSSATSYFPGQFNSPPKTSGTVKSSVKGSVKSVPRIEENEEAAFDPALMASVELATRYQEIKPSTMNLVNPNKVMTPAEFERYRQQQDDRRRMNKVFGNNDPDDSGDDYEDEDEDDQAERDRKATTQRRKQEAHLAVYRQTMRKITGDAPTAPPISPSGVSNLPAATQSRPELISRLSTLSFDAPPVSPAKTSDEDEDEDVPLGILAAHGFPGKNKPPNRLASSSSNPNLRGIVQQQQPAGPGSVAATEAAKRGSLPVFARHLPEDPYYGAGLVNPSHRESMAMHSTMNLAPPPSGASTQHPLHPAGLVGVIAGEERARAMRRGSPNAATGTFDAPPGAPQHPGMPRAQTTGSMPQMMGMPMMPGMPPMMPQMLTPGDQAQIQMSQQMTQMMQMQMQWMQQMQQYMGNAQSAGPQPMPQMSPMGPMGPMSPMGQGPPVLPMDQPQHIPRPQSVPLQGQGHPGQGQRAMSTLSPSMANWNVSSGNGLLGSTYAPSLAPSERSNIGLASRYRPVSTVPEPERPYNQRASTMSSTSFRPSWSNLDTAAGKKPAVSIARKPVRTVDDEDDEQGWAEMKAKKDKKQKSWKLRRGQGALQEVYNPTTSV